MQKDDKYLQIANKTSEIDKCFPQISEKGGCQNTTQLFLHVHFRAFRIELYIFKVSRKIRVFCPLRELGGEGLELCGYVPLEYFFTAFLLTSWKENSGSKGMQI